MADTSLKRSLPQNAIFHAICTDVARQATFAGRKLPAQQWKVLFCSGLAMVEETDPGLVQGLEGELVCLRESTAKMSSARMSMLIEYAQAWALLHGVELQKSLANS